MLGVASLMMSSFGTDSDVVFEGAMVKNQWMLLINSSSSWPQQYWN